MLLQYVLYSYMYDVHYVQYIQWICGVEKQFSIREKKGREWSVQYSTYVLIAM